MGTTKTGVPQGAPPEDEIVFSPENIDFLDQRYREDPIAFMEDCLMIQPKEGGGLIPFKLKPAQRMLVEVMEKQRKAGKPIRVIILKARQIGFSTVVQAYIFWWLTHHRYTSGLVIAHENDASANLWRKFVLYLENMPPEFKPQVKRKDEARGILELGTTDPDLIPYDPCYGSSLKIESAQDKQAGRSGTFQLIHASEVAFWPYSETFTALKQTIANVPGTLFVLESTANGATGQFYNDWKMAEAGKSDFIPIFVPWWQNEEYRLPVTEAEAAEWERFRKVLAETVEAWGDNWTKHIQQVWQDNGVLNLTPDEMEMAYRYPIDFGQIKWYRWALVNLCDNDPDKLKQEYPSSPDESFLTSGRPFFDMAQLISLKDKLLKMPRPKRYTIDEVASEEQQEPVIYEDPRGELYVWVEPDPERTYSIGADVAEGTAEGDNSAAFVVDNETLEHCATIWGKMDPDVYGRKLHWLGIWYNEALIGVEKNSAGNATVIALEDSGYRHLWGKGYPFKSRMKDHGWRTDVSTRKPILAHLKKAVREGSFVPKMVEAVEEMMTFIVNDKGKPEAQRGKTDDLVMAMAITLKMREEALSGQIPYMGSVSGVSIGRSVLQ